MAIIGVQGYLGLASWWVLWSNWVLAAVITLCVVMVFDHERLAGFKNMQLFEKGWVMFAAMMNINACYIEPEIAWWQQDLLLVGYTALLSVGIGCWQNADIPVRCLLFGVIIALMSCIYPPSILGLILVLIFLFYLHCFSLRNVVSVLSGLLFAYWMIYVAETLWLSPETQEELFLYYQESWQSLSYGLPTFSKEGYTGIIFIAGSIILFLHNAIFGFLSDNLSSLRLRSNVMLQSTFILVLIPVMASCWSFYLTLCLLTVCIHMLFSLSYQPQRLAINSARAVLFCYLAAGIAEPLIRMAWEYYLA